MAARTRASRAQCRPSKLSYKRSQGAERWPSGRRRTPAKGVRVISPSRVRIPLSPPGLSPVRTDTYAIPRFPYCQSTAKFWGLQGIDRHSLTRSLSDTLSANRELRTPLHRVFDCLDVRLLRPLRPRGIDLQHRLH